MNYTITELQAQHPEYRERLAEEIWSGNNVSLNDLKARRIEDPRIVSYKAKMAAGGENSVYENWLDRLVSRFAPLKTCLSVGAGRGRVEQHLVEAGLCGSFDAYDVCVQSSNDFMDLNFAELKPNAYDFILCHGALHHLINLEFVLDQINAALKPSGVLLIYEYIGERQWQFSTERMDMLRRHFPVVPFKPMPRWAINGFESVRSNELYPLISSVFGRSTLFSSFFGSIYFPFITCTSGNEYDHLLDEVIEFDQVAPLPPCYHVGLYGKTNSVAPQAALWTNAQLVEYLHRPFPLDERMLRALRLSPLGPILRRGKRIMKAVLARS